MAATGPLDACPSSYRSQCQVTQPVLTGGPMIWHRNHLLYKLFCASIRHYSRSLSRQIIGTGQGSQSAYLQLTNIIGISPPPGSLAAALAQSPVMLFNRNSIPQAVIAIPSCHFRSSRPDSQCNGLAGYELFKVQSGIKITPSLLVVKKQPSDNQKNQISQSFLIE